MSEIISVLDPGSKTIKTAIAEVKDNKLDILGYSEYKSSGIRDGEITDMETAQKAIRKAVDSVQRKAGVETKEFYISLTGEHIKGIDTKGLISTSEKNSSGVEEPGTINKYHINKVNEKIEENSMVYPFPIDRDILHIFPKEYIVDNRRGIKNPEGLTGRRLEMKAHISIYSTTATKNITRCLKNAGLKVSKFVLHSLASAYSTLSQEEKDLGTILLDIGADITDIIFYHQGNIHYTGHIPFGGGHVTRDIAKMLQISTQNAEKLKKEHGWALENKIKNNKTLEIDGLGGQGKIQISKRELAEVIEARMSEIFQEAMLEAQKINTNIGNTPPVVLTGGGALLKGNVDLCEQIFESSCRIVKPFLDSELNKELTPISSSVIGLLNYAQKDNDSSDNFLNNLQKTPINLGFFDKIGKFIDRIF